MRRSIVCRWSVLAVAAVAATGCGGDDDLPESIVWTSQVDSSRVNASDAPPAHEIAGVRIAVDLVAIVDGDEPLCTEPLRYVADPPEVLDDCMLIQYRVSVDSAVDEAPEFKVVRGVSSKGFEVTPLAAPTMIAYGGSEDGLVSAVLPNLDPGSTVSLAINASGTNEFDFVIPDDGFEHFDWDPGSTADEPR